MCDAGPETVADVQHAKASAGECGVKDQVSPFDPSIFVLMPRFATRRFTLWTKTVNETKLCLLLRITIHP